MSDDQDVTDKSFVGVLTILLALVILITFIIFLVLNLRHWKTQTYKIRVRLISLLNLVDQTIFHNFIQRG